MRVKTTIIWFYVYTHVIRHIKLVARTHHNARSVPYLFVPPHALVYGRSFEHCYNTHTREVPVQTNIYKTNRAYIQDLYSLVLLYIT